MPIANPEMEPHNHGLLGLKKSFSDSAMGDIVGEAVGNGEDAAGMDPVGIVVEGDSVGNCLGGVVVEGDSVGDDV